MTVAVTPWRRTLRVVALEARLNVMLSLEYRAGFFILMLNMALGPAISLLVWLAVLDRGAVAAGGGVPLPYARRQLVTYFVLIALVALMTSVWISEYVAADIRTGRLSAFLLRPAPAIAHAIGNNLGEKAVKLFLLLPLVAVLALVFRHDLRLPAEPWRWVAFSVALVLAAALSFMADYLLGSLAFWLQDVGGLVTLNVLLAALLAGRFIPLAFFPAALQPALAVQPWRFMLSFPLEVVTGTASDGDVAWGLALQAGYVVAAVVAHRLLWRIGLRAYAAVGA